MIVLYYVGSKEYCNTKDYTEARHDGTQSCGHSPTPATETVAERSGYIHRQNSRQSLGHGQKIKKFLTVKPTAVGDNLPFYYGNHSPSAAERECPYTRKHRKELPHKMFFSTHLQLDYSMVKPNRKVTNKSED